MPSRIPAGPNPNATSGTTPPKATTNVPASGTANHLKEMAGNAMEKAGGWVGVGPGAAKARAAKKVEGARAETRRTELAKVAGAQVQGMLSMRGDAPRSLDSISLHNEVGAALNLVPNREPKTPAELDSFKKGTWAFYGGASKKAVDKIQSAIESQGGKPPKVSVLPIAFQAADGKEGPTVVPLFRVETSKGPRFVDNQGRYYKNFEDWKDDNQLPPGDVSYPKDGQLSRDAAGQPLVVTEASHAVIDTFGERALQVADTAAMVGGFVVGAAAIIGTGGAATPLVGAALAAWSASRAASSLYDSATHGGALNPLTDQKARADWLNFASSSLSLGSMSATVSAVGQLAKTGKVVGTFSRLAPELTVASQVVGQASTVDSAVSLTRNWDQLSTSQKLLSTSQMVFAISSTGQAIRRSGLRGLYSPQAVREQLGMVDAEHAAAPKKKLVNQQPTDAEKLKERDFFRESERSADTLTSFDPKYYSKASSKLYSKAGSPAPKAPGSPQVQTSDLASADMLQSLRESPELNKNGQRARLMGARLVGRRDRTDGDFRYAYGRDAFDAWAKADAKLNEIPKGQLSDHLSIEKLSEINKLAYVAGDDTLLARSGHAYRGLTGDPVEGGRLRTGYDARSLPFKPESMEQVKNIRANGGEVSVVHTGDVGEIAILYAKGDQVQPGLSKLLEDTRVALKNPDADVINVGAEFAQRFITLHPFQDGNGRTARLVMDRILAERDVPPPILRDMSADVTLTRAQYADEVRTGVVRMRAALSTARYANNSTHAALGAQEPSLVESALRQVASVEVDGLRWTLGGDGFVYDIAGRAYQANAEGKLQPMTQLEQYFAIRRLSAAPDPAGALEKFTSKTVEAFYRVKAEPTKAQGVFLSDVDAIKADNSYRLNLKPAGNEALIGLFDPAKAQVSSLFKSINNNKSGTDQSFLISRYQQLDLEMWHVLQSLKSSGDAAGTEQLMNHRRALFTLAKTELQKAAPAVAGAPASPGNPLGFTQAYEKLAYENSPLSLPSLDQAIRAMGDDNIRVWRGDIFAVDKIGIYPDYLPTNPDAFDLAAIRGRNSGTASITSDLARVGGSSLGSGYLCYTSDLALLARGGGFADKQNTAVLNLEALPASVSTALKTRLAGGGAVRISDVSDLLGAVVRKSNTLPEGSIDVRGLTRAQFNTLVEAHSASWPAEARQQMMARFESAQGQGSVATYFGAPQALKLGDILGVLPNTDKSEIQYLAGDVARTVGSIEVTLSGEALSLATSRRAFLVEMKKGDALPGVGTLGGGTFEAEQEITGLGRVFPWRVKHSYSQTELAAPVPGAVPPAAPVPPKPVG